MSLRSSKSEVERFEAAARAWFPKPEFIVGTSYKYESLCHLLRVQHCPSRLFFDTVVDDISLQDVRDVRDVDQIAAQIMEPLAWKVHTHIASLGFGEPYNVEGFYDMKMRPWEHRDPLDDAEAKRALLNLFGIMLLEREAQGLGKLIFMVRHGKWARKISAGQLDKPIEWWQMFISSILASEGKL